MRKAVRKDPFIPVSLGRNQKGMQAGAELSGWRRKAVLLALKASRYPAVFFSWLLDALGAHKQVSNRILEPHSWCTQIFSATDVNNLFALRNHPDAEPHFQILAAQMQEQAEWSQTTFLEMEEVGQKLWLGGYPSPVKHLRLLDPGEWHLPFADGPYVLSTEDAKRVSTARCARTSYTLLDSGKISKVEDDLPLCERLFGGVPKHLSPTEHPAQAMDSSVYCGNFRGFKQFRKEIEGEAGGDRRDEESTIPDLVSAGRKSPNSVRVAAQALKALEQIDDMLVSNWVNVHDNDYPRAINDLIAFNLQIASDPAVNGGSIMLSAEEREHVCKLIGTYHVGPAAAPTIKKIRGF